MARRWRSTKRHRGAEMRSPSAPRLRVSGARGARQRMDLSKVAVVILAGGKGQRLEPLTRDRAKPAVPFGGIYRIIDFALSNCVNSGLKKISMLVQYRSRSLNRHIRDGWQLLFNPATGEYLEVLPPQYHAGD